LSTGSFQIATVRAGELADELARVGPRELLYCETADGRTPPRVEALAQRLGCPVTGRPAWQFRTGEGLEAVKRQFKVAQLAGFGLSDDEPALAAAGPILHYLAETQRADPHQHEAQQNEAGGAARGLPHLRPPAKFDRSEHLIVDHTSLRSLEVERTLRSESADGSLLGAIQHGVTSMGKRLLRQWLRYPRRDRATIEQRQGVVQTLCEDPRLLDELRQTLDEVQDVERIAARLASGGPRRATWSRWAKAPARLKGWPGCSPIGRRSPPTASGPRLCSSRCASWGSSSLPRASISPRLIYARAG